MSDIVQVYMFTISHCHYQLHLTIIWSRSTAIFIVLQEPVHRGGLRTSHSTPQLFSSVFGCDSSPRSPNVILCVCLSVTLATTVLKLKTLKFLVLKDFWMTSEGHLKDFWRTSEWLLKDFWRTLDFMVYKFTKSQPPGLRDLLKL